MSTNSPVVPDPATPSCPAATPPFSRHLFHHLILPNHSHAGILLPLNQPRSIYIVSFHHLSVSTSLCSFPGSCVRPAWTRLPVSCLFPAFMFRLVCTDWFPGFNCSLFLKADNVCSRLHERLSWRRVDRCWNLRISHSHWLNNLTSAFKCFTTWMCI